MEQERPYPGTPRELELTETPVVVVRDVGLGMEKTSAHHDEGFVPAMVGVAVGAELLLVDDPAVCASLQTWENRVDECDTKTRLP